MQHRSSARVQGLVFGGIMAALVVIFSLVPVLSILMPIPLVLVFVRYGGRVAVLTAVIATVFTMAFTGVVTAVLAIPAGILPGLVFGLGFRRGWRPMTTGLLAVLIFFLGFGLTYGVYRVAMFAGRDPFEAMIETPAMRAELEHTIDALEQIVVPEIENPSPQQQAALDQGRAIVEAFRRDPVGHTWAMLPSALFLMGVSATWVNYALFRLTLPRLGVALPASTPFEEFRLPAWLVWAYGLLMLGQPYFFSTDVVNAAWWAKLLMNIFSPLGMVLAVAGIAVFYGFLRTRNYGKGASALVVAAMVMLLGAMSVQVFTLLAMWDSIVDFRGLGHGVWKRPPEETT